MFQGQELPKARKEDIGKGQMLSKNICPFRLLLHAFIARRQSPAEGFLQSGLVIGAAIALAIIMVAFPAFCNIDCAALMGRSLRLFLRLLLRFSRQSDFSGLLGGRWGGLWFCRWGWRVLLGRGFWSRRRGRGRGFVRPGLGGLQGSLFCGLLCGL